MSFELRTLEETKIVGRHSIMSFARHTSAELWKSFMPHRKEIKHLSGPEYYSIEIYHQPDFFKNYDPRRAFDKWAGMKVDDFADIPSHMRTLVIPKGLYAVFNYKGTAEGASEFYKNAIMNLIPAAGYELDHRPHFAVMGEKYKKDDPESEEEIWFPIKKNTDLIGR